MYFAFFSCARRGVRMMKPRIVSKSSTRRPRRRRRQLRGARRPTVRARRRRQHLGIVQFWGVAPQMTHSASPCDTKHLQQQCSDSMQPIVADSLDAGTSKQLPQGHAPHSVDLTQNQRQPWTHARQQQERLFSSGANLLVLALVRGRPVSSRRIVGFVKQSLY